MHNTLSTLGATVIASTLLVSCSDNNKNVSNSGGNALSTVAQKYMGSYLGTCKRDDDGLYSVASSSLTTTSMTVRKLDYTDQNCAQPSSPSETVSRFSLTYPGGTSETSLGVADFADITLQTITVDGLSRNELIPQNPNLYTIFLLQGSSFYVGETNDESAVSPATRNTQLDLSAPAIRQ